MAVLLPVKELRPLRGAFGVLDREPPARPRQNGGAGNEPASGAAAQPSNVTGGARAQTGEGSGLTPMNDTNAIGFQYLARDGREMPYQVMDVGRQPAWSLQAGGHGFESR